MTQVPWQLKPVTPAIPVYQVIYIISRPSWPAFLTSFAWPCCCVLPLQSERRSLNDLSDGRSLSDSCHRTIAFPEVIKLKFEPTNLEKGVHFDYWWSFGRWLLFNRFKSPLASHVSLTARFNEILWGLEQYRGSPGESRVITPITWCAVD